MHLNSIFFFLTSTSLRWYIGALVPFVAAQSFYSHWQLTLIPFKMWNA